MATAAAAFLFQEWRRERERRDVLLRRYLAQLQDACESLWFRLDNLLYRGGKDVTGNDYLLTTMMYTLGRPLGIERMLALEGLYPQIRKHFPKLRSKLTRRVVDDAVKGAARDIPDRKELQQYDRLTLGETTVERDGETFYPVTFPEFRDRIGGPENESWKKTRKAVERLQKEEDGLKRLMCQIRNLALALSGETRMDSALKQVAPPCCEGEMARCGRAKAAPCVEIVKLEKARAQGS